MSFILLQYNLCSFYWGFLNILNILFCPIFIYPKFILFWNLFCSPSTVPFVTCQNYEIVNTFVHVRKMATAKQCYRLELHCCHLQFQASLLDCQWHSCSLNVVVFASYISIIAAFNVQVFHLRTSLHKLGIWL